MTWLLTAALLAAPAIAPVCSWDHPGAHAFMGDVVGAVDRYSDIPAPVRERLKQRMAARRYDDVATIERDAIIGRHAYAPELRDMHFGQGQLCATVTRERWSPQARERGLVYCESGHCLIVPTVCRNVARLTRLGRFERVSGAQAAAAPDARGIDVVALPPLAALPSFEQLALPAAPVAAPETPAAVALAPLDPDGGAGTETPLTPVLSPDPTLPALPPDVLIAPQPVPEPSVWLMMLAGLGYVARVLRRRARAGRIVVAA